VSLQDGLQQALRGRYAIERALGNPAGSFEFEARAADGSRAWIEATEVRDAVEFERALARAREFRHVRVLAPDGAGVSSGIAWCATLVPQRSLTLRTWLSREVALPMLETVRILREVAEGLEAAHRDGFVHGNLSPERVVWIEPDVALAGLAFANAVAISNRSVRGPLDDLHALGALGHELLTGRVPATAPVNALREHLPPGLARLIVRCLDPDPAQLPQSATDLLRVLAPMVTPRPGYEAEHVVQQARFFARRGGDGLARAVELFEQALALEPGNAAAREGLDDACSRLRAR
jgi:hypothetical protein